MRKNGNVLWIAPKDELAAKEKLELEAQAADRRPRAAAHRVVPAELHEGRGRRARLTGTAQPGRRRRSGTTTRILSPRGSVIVEARTNQLFVIGHPVASSRRCAELIAEDRHPGAPGADRGAHRRSVATPSASRSACGSAAASTGGTRRARTSAVAVVRQRRRRAGGHDRHGHHAGQRAAATFTNSQLRQPAGDRRCRQRQCAGHVRALAVQLQLSTRFLNLELSALEADGKGKIVSSPRVVTADQTKALIEQGDGNAVPGGHLQRRHLDRVPQGQPEARGHAADHAGRQRHPDVDVNKDSVGQRHARPASRSTPST